MPDKIFKPTTTTSPIPFPFPSDPRNLSLAKGEDFTISFGDACLTQAIILAKTGDPVTVIARGEWMGQPIEQKWVYMPFRDEEANKVLFVMVESMAEPGVDEPMSFRRIYRAMDGMRAWREGKGVGKERGAEMEMEMEIRGRKLER